MVDKAMVDRGNGTQEQGGAGQAGGRRFRRLGVSVIISLAAAILSSGQLVIALAQEGESLFARIERAVREKEPDWKLAQKHERKGAEHKYFMHGWTLGEEYVSTTTYQLTDATDATKLMADFKRSPVSVPLRYTDVQGLGDEAYTMGDALYSKKGSGTLMVRRVNIIIRLDSSSLETAKRFARHMLDEVDAICGGALCMPMN
jgi:hypothetical protein